MNDIFTTQSLAYILLWISGIALGWYLSSSRFNDRQQKLREAVDELETKVAKINAQFEEDPLRAAIDQGQRYVVNQVENLLKVIKETL